MRRVRFYQILRRLFLFAAVAYLDRMLFIFLLVLNNTNITAQLDKSRHTTFHQSGYDILNECILNECMEYGYLY